MLPQGHVPGYEGLRREEHGVVQAKTAAGNNFSAAIFIQLCRCLHAIAPLDSSTRYYSMESTAQTPGLLAVLGAANRIMRRCPSSSPPLRHFSKTLEYVLFIKRGRLSNARYSPLLTPS
jgi:hypothetical protein